MTYDLRAEVAALAADLDGDSATARTYFWATHWMKVGKGAGSLRPADSMPEFCLPAMGMNLYGAPRQADEEAERA